MTYQPLDHHLLKLAVAQSGAFSSAQAVAAGCSYAHLRHRERTGRIHRVRRGLYLHAGFPRSWLQDLWLEQLAAGDRSAVCGEAAAQLHGFNRFTRQTVEVERVQGGNHEAVRGSVHETFWLPPHHVTNVEGLPVTTVARTVFDLAGLPRHPAAFRNEGLREIHTKRITWLVNHAIRDHGMRMIDLNRVLAAVGRRGKPGTAIIRAVVADLGVDYEPAGQRTRGSLPRSLRRVRDRSTRRSDQPGDEGPVGRPRRLRVATSEGHRGDRRLAASSAARSPIRPAARLRPRG
jgi:hypothetical protein